METQYLQNENNFMFSSEVFKHQVLPSDVYKVNQNVSGEIFLTRVCINTDHLIDMPNSTADHIIGITKGFLEEGIKKAFEKYGMLYKRGLLMYGDPGTGKTCIINQLVQYATSKDMIVLLDPYPQYVKPVIEKIRGIEGKNRAAMVVWEEFEDIVAHNEPALLNLLDGIAQISDVFYVATTNYIEKVPSRIQNRPSRFADVVEVGYPTAENRRIFLSSKVHADDNVDLDMWVEATEGFTIDHLKDLIISVLVLGVDFTESVNKLLSMKHYEIQNTKTIGELYGIRPPRYEEDEECEATFLSPATATE